jgi:LuxR family transcriptional regulator, activator of conjugal transfer of Ti plasmids
MPESFVTRYLDLTSHCKSLEELSGATQHIFEEIGLPLWAYQSSSSSPITKPPVIIHNFPKQWEEHYVKNNYSRVDPVIVHGQHSTRPFQWSGLLHRVELTKPQKDYYSEASDVGLRDGLAIPIITRSGGSSVVSIAGDALPKDLAKLLNRYQDQLIAISFAFHTMASDFINRTPRPETNLLNAREKECLLWSMKGKSAGETGSIIGVTESTVNFHMENVKRKLGVYTRIQAVVKAIMEGHINP